MALPPPARAGIVRMEHGSTEVYTTRRAYRTAWYSRGWRSPKDDPLYAGEAGAVPTEQVATREYVENVATALALHFGFDLADLTPEAEALVERILTDRLDIILEI